MQGQLREESRPFQFGEPSRIARNRSYHEFKCGYPVALLLRVLHDSLLEGTPKKIFEASLKSHLFVLTNLRIRKEHQLRFETRVGFEARAVIILGRLSKQRLTALF